jgi:hypothetical protein
MLDILDQQFPHRLVNPSNPIFNYEIRQLRGPTSLPDLRQFSLRAFAGLAAIFILILILLVLSNGPDRGIAFTLLGMGGIFLIVGSVFGSIFPLVADLYYTMIAINKINQQIESGHWELVRLTSLDQPEILLANFAAVQVQVWRWMILDTLFAIGSTITGVLLGWNRTYRFQSDPAYWVVIAISLALSLLGPLWRMRAVVALGFAVSTAVRGTSFALLGGLAAVFIMRIVLVILTSLLTIVPLFFLGVREFDGLYGIFNALVGIIVTYGFYRLVKTTAFQYTYRRAF